MALVGAGGRTGNALRGGVSVGTSRALAPTRTVGPTSGGAAGPRSGGTAGPVAAPRSAGPVSYGGSAGPVNNFQMPSIPQPAYSQVAVSAPRPTANTNISVQGQRNPQYDALLRSQQQFTQNLKDNTGFASDVAATSIADMGEGARNRAKYLGGGGAAQAGQRQQRQQQISDAQQRANASAQAQMALGREAMVGQSLQAQLPTIGAGDQNLIQQQGVGLNAEALRQSANNSLFGQQLQGQQFATDTAFRNQGVQDTGFQQQMQLAHLQQQALQNPYLYGQGLY